MSYLAVRNWDRYQHYRTGKNAGRPAWIKLYVTQLRDAELKALPIPTRLLWDQLLLLAAEYDNRIPYDIIEISAATRIPTKQVLQGVENLVRDGFLGAFRKADDTPLDANPRTLDADRPRTEEKRVEEKRNIYRQQMSEIVATWHTHAPPLVSHRPAYALEPKVQSALVAGLRVYEVTDVCGAIENYATVLASELHYFSHRWTLLDFLKRGLDKFVLEADPLHNFLRDKRNGSKPAPLPRPVDEVLDLPDVSEEERLANLERLAEISAGIGA